MPELKQEKHAISLAVWNARPYVRWEADDIEPIRLAYEGCPSAPTMVRWAKQHGGWIINRHAPPGLDLPRIWPEIRPDDEIATKNFPTWHYHGDPAKVPARELLDAKHARVYSPEWADKSRHKIRDKYVDDHGRGASDDGLHVHRHLAKYVFPSSPRVDDPWDHDHRGIKGQERRTRHIAGRHHRGEDVAGNHRHSSRVKDYTSNYAARIDMHPCAVEKFADAWRVFFVIEGCVKADAVLSAGEAVLSVPSVTLWDCPELVPAVTDRYLRGRLVVIVPDSDWCEVGAVVTQARLLQTRLRREGIEAQIAAPPPGPLQANGRTKKVGVDDFLFHDGKLDTKLDDLEVIDRRKSPHLKQFAENVSGRPERRSRTYEHLWALSMHADLDGGIKKSVRSLARIMSLEAKRSRTRVLRDRDEMQKAQERYVKRFQRTVLDLQELGAISIDGNLGIRQGRFGLDWEDDDAPTITIREDLRAVDESSRTLGDSKPRKTYSK